VVATLAGQMSMGDGPQIVVDELDDLIESLRVTIGPLLDQRRQVLLSGYGRRLCQRWAGHKPGRFVLVRHPLYELYGTVSDQAVAEPTSKSCSKIRSPRAVWSIHSAPRMSWIESMSIPSSTGEAKDQGLRSSKLKSPER